MAGDVTGVDGNNATNQAAASSQSDAEKFAQMLDQAALSLGMQIFNQQQESLGEFQQEF
jgi:hypothetical protein